MLLFTPGPTPVPEEIRFAMSQKSIHHRTPEFEAIFAKCRELLLALFDMPEVLLLASSGSGAMEASVINLCKSKALVVNSGKFGERFTKICKAHKIKYEELKYEWDTPADIDMVLEILRRDRDIDAICIQISESAGGLRHPVEEIAKEIKSLDREVLVIADGITAIGVEKIDTTNIDALIGGSQKAFMLPPGLSMIGLSHKAVEKIGDGVGFYFNLSTELKNQKKNTTAWTAPTTLIIGLLKVLEIFFEKSLESLYRQSHARSVATQEALKEIGLTIYPKSPAISMSTVIDKSAEDIRKICKNLFNINFAGGQDHLKGEIFRINHMGIQEIYEASWAVNSVELALDRLGVRKFSGDANRIFLDRYYELVSDKSNHY